MIELTLGAQQRLDSYFAELRRVLMEDGKADPGDVERDIRDHIQTALGDSSGQVDESRLDQILRSLGAPAEWIEHPDRPWFARPPKETTNPTQPSTAEMLQRAAGGREGYLLPALSLLTLSLGLMLALFSGDTGAGPAIFVVAALGAFVLARAAIARQPNEWQSPVQKWLLSPSLLMVYVSLLIMLIGWPMVPGVFLVRSSLLPSQIRLNAAIAELENLKAEKTRLEYLRTRHVTISDAVRARSPSDYAPAIAQLQQEIHDLTTQGLQPAIPSLLIVGGAIIAWWVVLAIASRRMTEAIRIVFAPYSPQFVRRGMLGITSLTMLVALLLLV